MKYQSYKQIGEAWDKQNPDTKEKYIQGKLFFPDSREIEIFIYKNKRKYSDKQPDYYAATYREQAEINKLKIIQKVKDEYVRIGSAWNRTGRRGNYISLTIEVADKKYYLTVFKVKSKDSVVASDYIIHINRNAYNFLEANFIRPATQSKRKKKIPKKPDQYKKAVKKYMYKHLQHKYIPKKKPPVSHIYKESKLARNIDKKASEIEKVFLMILITIMLFMVPYGFIKIFNAIVSNTEKSIKANIDNAYDSMTDEQKMINHIRLKVSNTEKSIKANIDNTHDSMTDEQKMINYIRLRYEMKYASVRYVNDGDTIVLTDNTSIRYIGVDTPEMGYSKGEITEEGAKEALEENKNLVLSGEILLLIPWERERSYDRLLAYVYAPKKDEEGEYLINVSKYLLEQGLGDTKYGSPDKKLPYEIRDLEYLDSIIKK